jgi:ABC-type sugar transport system ATPase subunit
METPLVELKSVSKYFGSVIALKDVSFDVRAGEVHCLLGDNGAGKSTLIKVLLAFIFLMRRDSWWVARTHASVRQKDAR